MRLIVAPSEKGLRPKARPSSSRISLRTKIRPSQMPLRIGDEARGEVADRVGDAGRDEDVEAVVGGRVVGLGAAVGFAGKARRAVADLAELIADRVADPEPGDRVDLAAGAEFLGEV